MDNFKKFGGALIKDLGQYARDYIAKYPDVVIYVGSDSKQLRRKTVYATSVCFRHVGKGVHVVFSRYKIDKIKSMFERLYREVEDTRVIAEYLDNENQDFYEFKWTKELISSEYGKEIYNITDAQVDKLNEKAKTERLLTVDVDFNPKHNYKSNMVHDAGVGMMSGLGFRTRSKPHAWAATVSADLLCK